MSTFSTNILDLVHWNTILLTDMFTRGVGILIEEIINKYIHFMNIHYKSQGEAAEELNISRSHLNKIINKRDNPSLSLLMRMENKMKECGFDF